MKIKNTTIEIIQGDITELQVEAIVNAANTEMKMDAGLAKVIKDKGGDNIEEEAQDKGPVEVGEAVFSNAGSFYSNFIIHAAVHKQGNLVEQEDLRKAIANAFECAQYLSVESIAIPALGCGAGGFPLVGAAKIMVQEIMKVAKKKDNTIKEIKFCLYDAETFKVFDETVRSYVQHIQENLGPGPYVTVDIIIEVEDGIVLIERSNPPYGWALPGGFVDYGESLEHAAAREAKEETDLDLEDLKQMHTYSEPGRDPRFQTIATVFTAKGIGIPQFGDDAKGLQVIPIEELMDRNYAFDHKKIIQDYLTKTGYFLKSFQNKEL